MNQTMRAATRPPARALPTPIPAAAPGVIGFLNAGFGVLDEVKTGPIVLDIAAAEEALTDVSEVEMGMVNVGASVDAVKYTPSIAVGLRAVVVNKGERVRR